MRIERLPRTARSALPMVAVFCAAAAAALGGASVAVTQIETRSVAAIEATLEEAGIDWARVSADGLWLDMTGTAPDEAARFRALSLAGTIVDGTRVLDHMDVAKAERIAPPQFAIEILRTSDRITLVGLVPAGSDHEGFVSRVERTARGVSVADLLETADHQAPEAWQAAVDYAVAALEQTDSAKISVGPKALAVETMVADRTDRADLTRRLRAAAPEGFDLALDVSAPRPIISPYTLRLARDADGTRVDACAAPTEQAAERILAAARQIGAGDGARCPVGLGAPVEDWTQLALLSISTIDQVARGTVTLSDLDMRFEIGAAVDPDHANSVIERLDAALPDAITLTAAQADADPGSDADRPPEFIATRSPEGLVQLRGRLGTRQGQAAVVSFVRARFGGDQIDPSVEIAGDMPGGWDPKVLAALDALSLLDHGAAVVEADQIELRGTSGNPDASSEITRLLARKLGDAGNLEIAVEYDERLDPTAGLPTPAECVERINTVLARRQITFDPGSAIIDADSRASVDQIAEILRDCADVPMEVAGYTDSQGREEMNRDLSQSRADAVIEALVQRRVLTGALSATGYGEDDPIADNDTAEGREANRRIEFRLLEMPGPRLAGADDAAENDEEPEAADEAESQGDAGTGE